jgi:class 3 adenylate cyclase
MNTAARLEQATRDLDREFLVSDEALARLNGRERYVLEPLGPRSLRGREGPVEIYAVTRAR